MDADRKQEPSRFVEQRIEEIATNSPGPIADVACGTGRNAMMFADAGCTVYCLDNDVGAIARVSTLHSKCGQIVPMLIDLTTDEWPFGTAELGAVLCVHYFSLRLLKNLIASLKPHGYLLIETIDNRGGNYLELPKQGVMRRHLTPTCELKIFKEKKAGPPDWDACTARVLARKKP